MSLWLLLQQAALCSAVGTALMGSTHLSVTYLTGVLCYWGPMSLGNYVTGYLCHWGSMLLGTYVTGVSII